MEEAAWEPILDGPEADAARRAVRALAIGLTRQPIAVTEAPGVALFVACAAGLDDSDDELGAAHAIAMERLADAANEPAHSPGLFGPGSLAFRAFVLAHAAEGIDEYLDRVDAMLDELLAVETWDHDLDLIAGPTGIAIYLLERAAVSPRAASGLGHVVRHLDQLHAELPDGIAWHTPARLLPEQQRGRAPDGYYNCGVAHGSAGMIAVLARIAAATPELPRARALHDGAVRWVMAQRLDEPKNAFPSWILPGQPPAATRTAWCYGDAGMAASLWSAARRLGQPTESFHALMRTAAARAVDLCGVTDTPLCHGAFGLAHLYNRGYQASGDAALRDAARVWYRRGLAMRIGGGDEFVRTRALDPPQVGFEVVAPGQDVLEGKPGIGLALVAAIGTAEPVWDRILACDIPPRGEAA
jgi:hypothetical protein